MKRSERFSFLLLPLLILVVMAAFLMVSYSGVRYQASEPTAQILAPATVETINYFTDKPVDTLVLYDSNAFAGMDHFETVQDVLNSMQVRYDSFDVSQAGEYDLSKYENVVISFIDLDKHADHIPALMTWVENGGQILFSIRPDPSEAFNQMYRKLGIISKSDGLIPTRGVNFVTDLIPGAQGRKFGTDFIASNSYFVELEPSCKVYLTSSDEIQTPLLWKCAYQKGQFIFLNSDQFNTKGDRGIIGAAYSLLQDQFVYPVINSSMYFINEFPSPIRRGTDDLIEKQYSRDIQNFYVNIWWPDVQQLSNKYGIKYTGAFLETFNDAVIPPFSKQPENEKYRYFGGLLLNHKGEIALQGFNHVPLCAEKTGVNQQLEYPGWPSQEAMKSSLVEASKFISSTFPGTKITTYIPPSNIMCPVAREWLPIVLPGLRVISGLYLPGEGGLAYEQEFSEASDGIIELPRILGGYDPTSYMQWAAINELGLHYVNSYYISPLDVLSNARGSQMGWSYLREQFEQYVKWLSESAPGLRNLTAQEGATAVQRFDRLAVKTKTDGQETKIELGNFYDEAWLMMRSAKKPASIDGGTLTQVTSDLYLIQALHEHITIKFSE